MLVRDYRNQDEFDYLSMSDAFYHSLAVCEPVAKTTRLETLKQIQKHSPLLRLVMICNEEKEIAGYSLLAFSWSCEDGLVVTIDALYMKPSMRGLHYSTRFFTWLEKEYGDCLYQLQVNPDNIHAKRLYEKLGYRTSQYISMEK